MPNLSTSCTASDASISFAPSRFVATRSICSSYDKEFPLLILYASKSFLYHACINDKFALHKKEKQNLGLEVGIHALVFEQLNSQSFQ
jgi:hypothetical protein